MVRAASIGCRMQLARVGHSVFLTPPLSSLDCVAIKSGNAQQLPNFWAVGPEACMASTDILVENVTCAASHGLTIGSEMSGNVTNVVRQTLKN